MLALCALPATHSPRNFDSTQSLLTLPSDTVVSRANRKWTVRMQHSISTLGFDHGKHLYTTQTLATSRHTAICQMS
jgi:hypothetical protein